MEQFNRAEKIPVKSRPIYISGFDYAGYTLQFQLRRFFSLTGCSFNAFFSGLNLPVACE